MDSAVRWLWQVTGRKKGYVLALTLIQGASGARRLRPGAALYGDRRRGRDGAIASRQDLLPEGGCRQRRLGEFKGGGRKGRRESTPSVSFTDSSLKKGARKGEHPCTNTSLQTIAC